MSESDPTPLILISFLLRQAHLDSKDERHGDQGLLTSTQLIHLSHLVVLPGEAHLIVKHVNMYGSTRCLPRKILLLRFRVCVLGHHPV